MNGMDDPRKRSEESGGVHGPQIEPFRLATPQSMQQLPEQFEEKGTTAAMKENIRQMVARWLSAPYPVVQHVGPVLHGAVIGGKRVKEQVMSEDLPREDRTAEKWIGERLWDRC